MNARHPLPRLWLIGDPRSGDVLWTAMARLPRGAGVLFRRARADRAKAERIARRRGLVLIDEGSPLIARVHDHAELRLAGAAALIFVSPVFPTRSHPGAPALGVSGFARLAAKARAPVIALGGMTPERYRRLRKFGAYGWAAIDALTPERRQKRKAVPT